MTVYQIILRVPYELRNPITDEYEFILMEDEDREKVEKIIKCFNQRNTDPDNYSYSIREENVSITPDVLTYAENLPQSPLWQVDLEMNSAFQLGFDEELMLIQKVNQFTLVNSVAFAIDNDGRYVYVRANNEEKALTKAKEFFKQKC